MKTYPRILTIQDISCVGQCSMTVALPILSACGLETAILPSAVLSTHTAGFTGFTVRDLAEDIPAIAAHWRKEKLSFDAVYTGYLGSTSQIDMVLDIFNTLINEGGLKLVDPAMADHGKLYPAFDMEYVEAMKRLCGAADYCLPNITEASFLTGIEYKESYDETYILSLCEGVRALGAKAVILTGVGYKPDRTGVVIYQKGKLEYYEHEKLPINCHGTGDVYASAFTGALLRGSSAYIAAAIAADYTVDCIAYTSGDKEHWYGVKFEPLLGKLMSRL